MRVIAFILSLYVLFLAALPLPGFTDIFSEDLCCQDACEKNIAEQAQDEEDGCSELCNPFLSCSCSIGFTTAAIEAIQDISSDEFAPYLDQMDNCYLNPFIFQVWHPPKA